MLGLVSAYLFNNLFVFDQISSYILFFTILAYVHSHASEMNLSLWDNISAKMTKMFDNEKGRPIIEALILVLIIGVLYFVIYLPWQQNKDLLEVLKTNNQGKVADIKIYTKPLSSGMGFSESLEHISQTAIAMATNQNISTEFKQELFDAVDKSFNKNLDKVPDDARYRLFYGIFLSRFGLYEKAIEQVKEAQKLSPNKQQMFFELTSNYLLNGKTNEALGSAKIAYELDTSFEEAKFIYGLTLLASGDTVTGSQILGEIPESKLVFDDRYLTILLSLSQYQEIINIVNKRIELDPSNLQHRITLTAVYLQANRRTEAIQTLEEIIILDPTFKEQGEYYINEIKAGRNP